MFRIIIPAYNEEKRISPTLESYGRFFSKLNKEGLKNELLVVINNSTDNTIGIVEKYSKIFPNINYINLKPGGKGFAIINGFKHALNHSNVIGFVDADGATSPEAFYDLYLNLKNYDGIIGSRWKKDSNTQRSIGKLIRSKGFNILTRVLFLFPYQDTQCGAKIFRRKVVEKIVNQIEIPEWGFDVNVLYLCKKHKFNVKEHPTIWVDKEGSKIKPIKVPIQMAGGAIRLRLLNSPFNFLVKAYDKLLPERLKIHNIS